MNKNKILDKSHNFDVIAFDFFDTLVHRTCHPEVIIYQWAKICSNYLERQITPKELISYRKKAEIELKSTLEKEEFCYEEILSLAFDELQKKTKISFNKEELIQFSREIELKIELKNIYLDEEMLSILEKLKTNQKRVVVVSDFYAGNFLIVEIMKSLDIFKYFEKVFISCEIGLRKSSGNLYNYVLKQLDISSSQLLMIGDNKLSDFEVPSSKGIEAIWREYKDPSLTYHKSDVLTQLKKHQFSDPLHCPFNCYLSEIYYFIENLYFSLKKSKVKNVLFCSREGQLLKQFFDVYQEEIGYGQNIKAHYFYVSRKSTLLPSLGPLSEETFDVLFRQYSNLTLENFLLNLDFSKSDRNKLYKSGLDKNLLISPNTNNYRLLIENPIFSTIYESIRVQQQELFNSYLSTFNIDFKREGLHMVDIGWKGTIQDNIQSALKEISVNGYYLGLDFNYYRIKGSNSKKGILFTDYPKESSYFNLFNRNSLFYENIFAANHTSVIGYEKKSNSTIPKLSSDNQQLAIFNLVKNYQLSLLESYKTILKVIYCSEEDSLTLYKDILKSAIYKNDYFLPKIWHFRESLNLSVVENFGIIHSELATTQSIPKSSLSLFLNQFKRDKKNMYVNIIFKMFDKRKLRFIGILYSTLIYCIDRLNLAIRGIDN